MIVKAISLALISGFWLLSPTRAEAETDTKSFVYKKTKEADLQVKVYYPADWKPSDTRPAIVFFFGGGWNSGKLGQFDPQSKHFAERGMVALCADYRVKSRHGTTPDKCVEDAKSAVRWMRENASMLGIDPDKIVGSGGSAGGHLAACTGICPGLDYPEENLEVSSVPNVLVLFNPVLDFNSSRLLARVKNDTKLANAISPTTHLRKDSPSTLILFGTNDKLAVQADSFLEKSKELGHTAELFLAEGVGHGFFNRPPWLKKTTQQADDFLVSQGILEKVAP